MIVLVKWTAHNRQYSIGLQEFLKQLDIDVKNEKIEQTVKRLLEQQELKPHEPAEHK